MYHFQMTYIEAVLISCVIDWVSDDELEAPDATPQSLRQTPPSLDYIPGPEHPPSPDYVPGPEEPEQAPLSPDYVPEPEYPEYLVPSDAEAPIEDQPLPDDASPTTLSPGYIADSDPEKDPEEDPEEDPTDGGDDDDDESSDDDDDDDEQEASEDDDGEEEHPALADSFAVPVDPVSSAEDKEEFKTDDFTPMSAATEALIAEVVAALPLSPPPSPLTSLSFLLPQIPSPPLHVPSPPLPQPSPPTHTSPTYDEAPLGYRAAGIRLRAASPSTHHPSKIPSPPLLLPSTTHRDDLPKVDIPLRKRARFTALASGFKVGKSSAAVATRQPGLDVATLDVTPGRPMYREVGYGIEDVWDDMVGDMEERAPTIVEDLSQRVTDLSTTLARDTHEIYVRLEDAQDDRALQRAGVQTHETHIQTRDAHIGSLETLVMTLVAQTSSLQTQLTITLGRIQTLEAREPTHIDNPEDAGSSS
ncbi:hypothetical protein Tco_1057053 [Tanacetum coccineum]|uniref:Uncharacterized protein n=1 Tax=Tanacetum coccineum TaxID=301880 RepID=A0ABQ5H4H5_9ASTR